MANIEMTAYLNGSANPAYRPLRVEGYEELGRSFEYHVEFTHADHQLSSDTLLGSKFAVEVKSSGEGTASRFFHGIVTSFRYIKREGGYSVYQVVLRPWSWLLSKRADCRIFQNMTAVDIIKQVFQQAGATDYTVTLNGTYVSRVYCVQYRESDLDFVTRLMEQEGIYYSFKHEASKHTLAIVDDTSSLVAAPVGTFYFDPSENHGEMQFREWRNSRQVLTTKYRLQDYNFTTPDVNLVSASTVIRSHGFNTAEIYDYPGLYQVGADGQTYVKVRAQEQQAHYDVSEGVGDIPFLTAGQTFSLEDHDRNELNAEYMLLSTRFSLVSGQSELASLTSAADRQVHCEVQALPKATLFRLRSQTPRPRIAGPQTAVVVGPAGQEIYTDQYGQVKVKFRWDLTSPQDESVSCWVRVSQSWAGQQWGSIHVPRIGQEVIVEFLEGDPDRPLITGRVYNAALMPPYVLSDNATQSGFKTRSTPNGDANTFNELRFEDKKDQEQIYFHAEKDFARVVENNDSLKVGFDKKDKGDQTIEIFNNQTITIGHDDAETGHRTTTLVKGNEVLTVKKGTRTVTLDEGADTHQVKKGDRTVLVDEGNDTHTIAKGNRTVSIDKGNDALTVGEGNREVTVSQGDLTVAVAAGKVTIEAGTSIELKVGSNSIKIESAGVTISATKISLSGTGAVEINGSGEAKLTSGGIVTVQGSLVKIN